MSPYDAIILDIRPRREVEVRDPETGELFAIMECYPWFPFPRKIGKRIHKPYIPWKPYENIRL